MYTQYKHRAACCGVENGQADKSGSVSLYRASQGLPVDDADNHNIPVHDILILARARVLSQFWYMIQQQLKTTSQQHDLTMNQLLATCDLHVASQCRSSWKLVAWGFNAGATLSTSRFVALLSPSMSTYAYRFDARQPNVAPNSGISTFR